ncbi:MAG: DNA mismatch repair protein MutS, partial [Deltaproteobacteria bacterium]|nr:DNA mismatch repair protein MutS [Deltaproteobacteria bacterium]
MKRLTPAMEQYLKIKEGCKDAILFFRMGDFYEMFFEDAKLAAGILGIALTSRDKGRNIPMCGIPYHSVSPYIAKLVKEGHKVALCEQMEDPKDADGVVERGVVRVITPGTAIEDELLEVKANNYIAAATLNGKKAGFAYMDITTGEFRVTELEGLQALKDEILRIGPSELLLPEGADISKGGAEDAILLVKNTTYLDSYDFYDNTSLERMREHFEVSSLDGFGLKDFSEGLSAAGALLFYAKKTQKNAIRHIKRCSPYWTGNFLVMDHSTRRNLEIFENARTLGKEGTLLSLLDRTRTPMGGRKLKNWLLFPLLDTKEIEKRLLSVEELLEKRVERREVERVLSSIHDMERLSGKVSIGVCGPKDLVSLRESLERTNELKERLGNFSSVLLVDINRRLDCVPEAASLIEASLKADPPHTIKDGGFMKEGFSGELDALRELAGGGKEWIARLESEERKRTRINTLKVGYNRVFGYYIEVTNPNLKNIPSDYIRKQTLANAERFVTPELKEWELKILNAEEKARALEGNLFRELTEEVSRKTG